MPSDESGLSDLQFDRAERPNSSALSCAACHAPIADRYYSLVGYTLCESCAQQQSQAPQQPSAADLARAAVYGAGAAIAGTLVYFAVLALSGYEIGLIAVAVGWAVGKAVQKGSRGIGGRKLQFLAITLTYLSIVGSYVPLTIKYALDNPQKERDSGPAVAGADRANSGSRQSSSPTAETVREPRSAGGFIVGMLILFAFCLAAPFLGGLSNLIGLFIIGIGLFEAWKLNRRVPMTLEGPFPVSGPVGQA